jgi:hypothetical protein
MEEVEAEMQSAAAHVMTELRTAHGLDTQSADRLRSALRAAAVRWAASATITKSAANLFVDLAPGIDACSYAYPGDEGQSIRDFAVEVADLVRACVAAA